MYFGSGLVNPAQILKRSANIRETHTATYSDIPYTACFSHWLMMGHDFGLESFPPCPHECVCVELVFVCIL